MPKWIKNNDTIDHTWVGQLVPFGTYYEIQPSEEISWANNSQLITDIGSGIAIVAKDDSGNTNISDVNQAINYLKGNLPSTVINTGIKDPDGKRARLKGICFGIVAAGTTVDFDWTMDQLQYGDPLVNKNSIFDGVQYYAENAKIGDKISFQVVHPTAGVLEEFGDGWYVAPNQLEDIILYKSSIFPGLILRAKYTSTGTVDVNFFLNLYRHLEE